MLNRREVMAAPALLIPGFMSGNVGQKQEFNQPIQHSHNMNPLDFCYWVQGLMEIGNPQSLDKNQIDMIKRHLALVFNPVTQNPGVIYHMPHASC